MPNRSARILVLVVMIIGISLAAAPGVFQMFERAPLGGEMIDDFTPFMTTDEVQQFRGYLTEIDAATAEAAGPLADAVREASGLSREEYDARFSAVTGLVDGWDGIDADMSDLIDRMDRNLDNFEAVTALPPFPMFPWFFVIPGVFIAVVAASVVWSQRGGHRAPRRIWLLVGLGLAVATAPTVFQMFTRAPKGADMIDDFRPMMTRDRVQNVQGYFITMGAAEGQMRTKVLPLLAESGGDTSAFPATQRFSSDWPTIVVEFNPMIATMNDSLDNYAAVDALPSFGLFPWFFVGPGLMVAGAAFLATRRRPADPVADAPADLST